MQKVLQNGIEFRHYWEQGQNEYYSRTGGRSENPWGEGGHTTEIDFALSFGVVIVKMIDLSKTESRDWMVMSTTPQMFLDGNGALP